MKYAYIRDSQVIELFSDDPKWPTDLDVRQVANSVGVSYTVDSNGSFHAPAPVPLGTILVFSDFMSLFSDTERVDVAGQAMTDAQTKIWYDMAAGAPRVDLNAQYIKDGLQTLVDAGLLTAARRTKILSGQPPGA